MNTPPIDNNNAIIASQIQDVIRQEANAIRALEPSLLESGPRAVAMMLFATGRIIVTGMGKSGHVARKITATLASTGTPAYFVHPAEAGHGDLGMIQPGDLVLALSNSGQTLELHPILDYCQAEHIPLIAITRNIDSALGKAADLVIKLPKIKEAGHNNLAPTSSTTQQIVIGDALAAACSAARAFSPEDFYRFHPGGKLGKLFESVSAVMRTEDRVPLVKVGTLMAPALGEMTSKAAGCLGIVDQQGCLVGIITDGDLRRNITLDLRTESVEALMTPAPITIIKTMSLSEATGLMREQQITQLFVVENGKPVGLLHIHDCP